METVAVTFLILALSSAASVPKLWLQNFSGGTPIDLIFILDRSSAAGNDNAVAVVLNTLANLNSNGTRIAIVTYNTQSNVIFSDIKERVRGRWCEAHRLLMNLTPPFGYSTLTQALIDAENLLLESSSAQKSIVLLVGSKANGGPSPIAQATRLKSLRWSVEANEKQSATEDRIPAVGVALYVLAYGAADNQEVRALAAPYQDRLQVFGDDNQVKDFAEALKPDIQCAYDLTFPDAGVTSYDDVSVTIPDALTEFTICLWVRPSQRSDRGALFSLSDTGAGQVENVMTLTNITDLQIFVNGMSARSNISLSSYSWHHACAEWTGSSGNWRIHVNGSLAAQGEGLAPGWKMEGGSVMSVGQLPRLPSGIHDESATYSGSLTQVHVFSRALTMYQIQRLSDPTVPCAVYAGDSIQWTDFLSRVNGTSIVRTRSLIGADVVFCESRRNCSAPCATKRTCWNTTESFVCECDSAELCESTYERCDDSYCFGDGVCYLSNGEMSCSCSYGYTGSRCEARDNAAPCARCQNGAKCVNQSCACVNGYLGQYCNVAYEPDCANLPCYYGNGTCSLDSSADGYHCQCPDETNSGRNCQPKSKCDAVQCPNGAICLNLRNSDYECVCVQNCSQTTGNGDNMSSLLTNSVTNTPGAIETGTIQVQFNVVLRLQIDYQKKIEDDMEFKDNFVKQVTVLFVPTYAIAVEINSIRPGSVVVDFDLKFYASPVKDLATTSITASTIEKIFKDDLKNGNFGPFPATEDDLLQVTKLQVTNNDSAPLGAIIGGTVSVVVLIIAVTSTLVYCRIKARWEFERMRKCNKSSVTCYDLSDLAASQARSTPRSQSHSSMTGFIHRWSSRHQNKRSDTLQTLMAHPEGRYSLGRGDVVCIEVHDNLAFVSDSGEPGSRIATDSPAPITVERVSLVTQPPPRIEHDDLCSIVSSDTLKANPESSNNSDDSDFNSSIGSCDFDYNEELARSLKELDRICSEEKLNAFHDLNHIDVWIDEPTPSSNSFSLRRHEIITDIDEVELSDEVEANNTVYDETNETKSTYDVESPNVVTKLDFQFFSNTIPNFEVIPTLELPPEKLVTSPSRRARTYSEQQRIILTCFHRQKLQYF